MVCYAWGPLKSTEPSRVTMNRERQKTCYLKRDLALGSSVIPSNKAEGSSCGHHTSPPQTAARQLKGTGCWQVLSSSACPQMPLRKSQIPSLTSVNLAWVFTRVGESSLWPRAGTFWSSHTAPRPCKKRTGSRPSSLHGVGD